MCGVSRGNGWRYSDNINRGWCGVVWCGVVWWVGGLVEGIGRGYKRNGPVSPTEPRVARRPWSYASRHGASRWRMRRPGRSGRSRCPRAVDLVLVLVLVLSLSLSRPTRRGTTRVAAGAVTATATATAMLPLGIREHPTSSDHVKERKWKDIYPRRLRRGIDWQLGEENGGKRKRWEGESYSVVAG